MDIVLEETTSPADYNHGYLDNMLNTPYSNNKLFPIDTNSLETRTPLLPLRRARAGTMPSVIYMDQPPPPPPPQMPPAAFPIVTNNSANRHRSGSLTLPVPATYAAWRPSTAEPTSPSTEQLLQQGDDIARTLRSIGLDDDKDGSGSSPLSSASNSIATPPTGGSPSATLLQQRNTLRSRSYSVNNAAMYQQQTPINNGFSLSSSSMESILLNNNNHRNNSRPRASSMGKMDYNTNTPPGLSSLWKMQLGTLEDDSIYESNEENNNQSEHSLSLGDSEFLANMFHTSGDGSNKNTMKSDIDVSLQIHIYCKMSY